MVALDGFEDGAGDAELAQPVAQGAAPALVVGEGAPLAERQHAGVEPGLADIDADDWSYSGGGHSYNPFLLAMRGCTRASVQVAQELLRRANQAGARSLRARQRRFDPPPWDGRG